MKLLARCLLCLFLSFSLSSSVYAVASTPKLSDMSELECLKFIQSQGVDIPHVYPDETTWAPFVKQIIQKVEKDPHCEFVINYTVSLHFAEEIRSVVNNYYGVLTSPRASTDLIHANNGSYVLVDSTLLGTWDSRYKGYNCYSYALGITTAAYDPGMISTGNFSIVQLLGMDLDDQVDLIIDDLEYWGYHCISKLSYCPSFNVLTAGYHVICYRVGMYDYHFMRMDESYWSHKPGRTQPLKYKYTPVERPWNNESYDGEKFSPPSSYYNSEVHFIKFSIPEIQYSYNNQHEKICPGCDTLLDTENCSPEYTYYEGYGAGDCHRLVCRTCGHIDDYNLLSCRLTWGKYGLYNGVPCHIRCCADCGHQVGAPQPCVYTIPGECDTCGY